MDKNNNTLSEVRKTAAQRMWDAENKQRAKSDASNKRTPSSIPVPDKKLKSESATLAAAVIGGAALMRMHQKLKDKKAKQATEKPAKPVKEENVAEGYNDLDREYGGAKGRSDDAIATARRTRQAKAAAKAAGKTFNTSAEYRLWHMKQKEKQGVAEGATGAKPGWMLRQDPVLGSRVKAAQAKQKEFKKLVGTKVPVKEPVKEAIIEAHTEDDIANGGTVIYKHDGKHYMAKVSHKTGGGAGTMIHTTSNLGHKIKLNQVVSTDASDWTKFKNIKEETEQVNELNKDTLYSYALKADKQIDAKHKVLGSQIKAGDTKAANKTSATIGKRMAGMDRAETRLNKESKSFLDIRKELDEKNLTPVEKIAREELSKMKYKKVRGAPTE